MAKLINQLFGMLMPGTLGVRDEAAPAAPPTMIPGARNGRELCMLPTDANLPAGREMEIVDRYGRTEKRIVQLKADGIAALYIDGRIYSREGAPLDCALHCQPGLQRMERKWGQELMIQGEYVADDGFNATLSEFRKGEGNGVFWAFDAIPLEQWMSGRSDMPIENRLAALRHMIVTMSDSLFVGMLDHWLLTPIETIAKAREIWAAGGEGIVSKTPGSPYIRDRSADWLRVKETHTVDGYIVDMMEKNGDLKNMTVIVPDAGGPKWRTIIVGTGWTKTEGRVMLDAFKVQQSEIQAQWVEISFQLTTGASRTVRGARFHRQRPSKFSGNITGGQR